MLVTVSSVVSEPAARPSGLASRRYSSALRGSARFTAANRSCSSLTADLLLPSRVMACSACHASAMMFWGSTDRMLWMVSLACSQSPTASSRRAFSTSAGMNQEKRTATSVSPSSAPDRLWRTSATLERPSMASRSLGSAASAASKEAAASSSSLSSTRAPYSSSACCPRITQPSSTSACPLSGCMRSTRSARPRARSLLLVRL
mmetsp:Transcript_9322/g.23086  ORF Transcript_9322/g.23086 Transcript_9322/m.23086 type:complete len:204 (-) Transcript_9322:437-1048(-)